MTGNYIINLNDALYNPLNAAYNQLNYEGKIFKRRGFSNFHSYLLYLFSIKY